MKDSENSLIKMREDALKEAYEQLNKINDPKQKAMMESIIKDALDGKIDEEKVKYIIDASTTDGN